MSHRVSNAVSHAVTNAVSHSRSTPLVTHGVTGAQNQNQNQTVVKAAFGWSMADVAFIHQAVDARAAMNEQKP